MKFRRPSAPGDAPHPQGSFTGKPPGKPEWFKEWLANKGSWVLLDCGHKADLNENGQINMVGQKRGDMLTICEECYHFSAVERHLTFSEYKGIPTAVIPDEPQF